MQRSFHGFVELERSSRRMMAVLLAGLVAAALSGCASPVLMKNPTTGEIAQCYSPGDIVRRYHERDKCVEEYQKQGWVMAESP